MRPVLDPQLSGLGEAQVRLVHQCSGVEQGSARRGAQAVVRHAPQVVIADGEELVERLAIAGPGAADQHRQRHVSVHG